MKLRSAFALALVGLAAACGAAASAPAIPTAPASPSPSQSASATAAASGSATSTAPEKLSWNEAAIVDKLAQDCHWTPPVPDSNATEDPLACFIPWDQSCVPNYCFEAREDDCEPKCKKGCETCSTTCASSCDSCKASCKDDACKKACAKSSGECHETCVVAADRCHTGDCIAAEKTCQAKIDVDWDKSPCKARCDREQACLEKCIKLPDVSKQWPCNDSCWKTVMRGCDDRFKIKCGFL